MPAGRPTEYSEEIVSKTNKYIDSCVDEIENYHKTQGNKSDSYERIVNVKIPTIEGLAVYLKIGRTTVYEWIEKFPEFACIIEQLRATQADRLLNNGLSGNYNPTIAKVLLTKHGYRDETGLTGPEGKPLNITFDSVFENS
jgi:hypothetical protein